LKDILDDKKEKGMCQVCGYNTTHHLVAVRMCPDKPTYKKLHEYSKHELTNELKRYTILCTWCFRIHMTFINKITNVPPFNSDLPCCGRICNSSRLKYKKYQLCEKCFYYHVELKKQLYAKVNAYKRHFKHCPSCKTKIMKGNEMCFDLDHLDPYQKKYNISHLLRRLAPFHIIKKEMEKCRILCCHCHLDHTKTQQHIFKRRDFQNVRQHLRSNGIITNPKTHYSLSDSDSSYEDMPKVKCTYNPLHDPSPKFKPPPNINYNSN